MIGGYHQCPMASKLFQGFLKQPEFSRSYPKWQVDFEKYDSHLTQNTPKWLSHRKQKLHSQAGCFH